MLILLVTLCFSILSTVKAQDVDKMTYHEIDSLFQAVLMAGDLTAGFEVAQKGLERAKKEKNDSMTVVMMNALGYLQTVTGDFKQAETTTTQTLEYAEKKLGKSHIEYASSLNTLATLYYQKGNYKAAIDLFKEVCLLIEQAAGKDHAYYAAGVQNLSLLLERMGQLEEAEYYYLEVKALLEKSNQTNTPLYYIMTGNLGSLYEAMGQEQQAEQIYISLLETLKEIKGLYYIMNLNNLGNLYKNMHRHKEALKLFEEAEPLAKELLGEQNDTYGAILINLASTYEFLGDLTQAERIYKTAININKKVGNEDKYASSLRSLGGAYVKMKRYEAAEKHLKESLELTERVFGKNHYNYTFTLYHLANLARLSKNYSEAYRYLHEAINRSVGLNLGTELNSSWADSIYNVGQLNYEHFDNLLYFLSEYTYLLREDRPEDQSTKIIIANLALRLIERAKNEFHKEEDKLRIAARLGLWIDYNLSVIDLDKNPEKAFLLAEQDKASLLLEATQSQRAYNFGGIPDSLIKKEKALNASLDQIQAKILESPDPKTQEKLRQLLNDKNIEARQFQEQIKKNYPKYAQFKYENKRLELETLQADLKGDMAVLEYTLSTQHLYIFYIDQERIEVLRHPLQRDELKAQIREFHHILSDYAAVIKSNGKQQHLYVEKAHWFYQQTIAPVKKFLEGKRHLLIIPDRELGHLPFEVFLVERPKNEKQVDFGSLHYLLNDFAISYDYSANLWQENTKRVIKTKNTEIFAAAANYTEAKGNARGVNRLPLYRNMRDHLQALPAARVEVEQLAKRYRGYFAFDNSASERNFKAKAGNYSIIHLAMHGLLNETEPILSSLAFTEDADSLENNFLQAYEISKMDLNANLVVLSACETGYGRFERGNGIASLARAFMYAGTPALVVSLWQVHDASTAIIMQNFYAQLEQGLDKAEALQQAKLEYIKLAASQTDIAAHPAFWAAFIQMGNTTPIKVASRQIGGAWLWGLVALGVVALGLMLMAWRNRKRRRAA